MYASAETLLLADDGVGDENRVNDKSDSSVEQVNDSLSVPSSSSPAAVEDSTMASETAPINFISTGSTGSTGTTTLTATAAVTAAVATGKAGFLIVTTGLFCGSCKNLPPQMAEISKSQLSSLVSNFTTTSSILRFPANGTVVSIVFPLMLSLLLNPVSERVLPLLLFPLLSNLRMIPSLSGGGPRCRHFGHLILQTVAMTNSGSQFQHKKYKLLIQKNEKWIPIFTPSNWMMLNALSGAD
jgi:hypothetical protein